MLSVVGVVIVWIFLGIPCNRDIPVILNGNLIQVSGVVTSGSMSGEKSNSMRRFQ